MAWTHDDLNALDTSIARGIKKVTFADGRSREYQSADEMLNVRREIKAELAASASQVRPRRVTVARFRR